MTMVGLVVLPSGFRTISIRPTTPGAPRHAASVFVHAGALWMVAGNNMKPDVHKLTRKEAAVAAAQAAMSRL